jgi:hypothetical protein
MHSPCVPNPSCTKHSTARYKCLQVSQYPAQTCLDTVCSVSTATSAQTTLQYITAGGSRDTYKNTTRAQPSLQDPSLCPCQALLHAALRCNAQPPPARAAHNPLSVTTCMHATQPNKIPTGQSESTQALPIPPLYKPAPHLVQRRHRPVHRLKKEKKLPASLVPTGRGVGASRPQEHTSQLHTYSQTP